jgi:hypothetical protein
MDLIVAREDVWAASIKDQPGALAEILSGLRAAGADLNFILARRSTRYPGKAAVFVTPIRGDNQISAASSLGFNVTSSVQSLRIEGDNKAGIAAEVTEKLGKAGINLRGMSAAVNGDQFVMYIGFNSADDAEKALAILQRD